MNQDAIWRLIVVNTYDYHDLVASFSKYRRDKLLKQIARKDRTSACDKPIKRRQVKIIKSTKPAKELKKRGIQPRQIFRLSDRSQRYGRRINPAGYGFVGSWWSYFSHYLHSLEIWPSNCLRSFYSRYLPACPSSQKNLKPKMELVSRKPIFPSQEKG